MKDLIDLYKLESCAVFDSINNSVIESFFDLVFATYIKKNKLFACGNGGNCAYVANLITDLNLHPFVSEDKTQSQNKNRFHTINLCDSVSTITAIANDIGPEHIFGEQLKFSGKKGDLLIAISGSGNSANIINGAEVARQLGMNVIGITKNEESKLKQLSNLLVIIRGDSSFPGQTGKNNNNFHFEDCLSKLSHIITGILKMKVANES